MKTKPQVLLIFLHLSLVHLSSFHSITPTANPNKSKNIPKEQLIHSLFKQCFCKNHLTQIHALIIKTGFHQHLLITGKIISRCAVTLHAMDYALNLFDEIKTPDGFIWNSLIRGMGKTNQPKQAFGFYKRMLLETGGRGDNFTYSFLLKICGQVGDLNLGKQVHCCSLKDGFDVHVFVRNTLIHVYGMHQDYRAAHSLFDEIPKPDVVAWNTIIDSYVSCAMYKEALEMFLNMYRNGVQPDDATMVVVLSACSELGALDFGEWVHSIISCSGLDRVVSVSNSIIDMYAKCGQVKRASFVFDKLKNRNLVSWNSMILGFAMNGYADDALRLFDDVCKLKHEIPDGVTFLGVLFACSHGGLVDEGRMYFASMTRTYGIKPTIKHYGCMVDLLGRAGLVKEAYQLILGMPMECNSIVWRTLLGACRVHGDLELGERVRRHIMELEPDHSGDYVLLANMYASEGRWNDMSRVRATMRSRRIQKLNPGNSVIEHSPSSSMDRAVHEIEVR